MQRGEQVTGVRDENYDLISVLYHALEGAETYSRYCEDAEQKQDQELSNFFREAQEKNVELADRARELLRSRIARGTTGRGGGASVDEKSMESFPASDPSAAY